MEVKIEDNVPVPNNKHGNHRKWPFADLKIGQSFLMPDKEQNEAAAAARYWEKKLGVKFITRRVLGGSRVWRTR